MLPIHQSTLFIRALSTKFLHLILIAMVLFLVASEVALSHPNQPAQPAFNTEAVLEILIDHRLAGSGWFISPDGLAITAAHSVKQAATIEVITKTKGRLKAMLIATDTTHDLALLKVERPAGFFPYLQTSQSDLVLGQQLYSFGSALYRHDLFFTGQVASEKIQYEWNEDNRCYTEVRYLSALTPKGLSGAPWVNHAGEVVGTQSGMVNWKGALMGIAFISPASAAKKLLMNRRNPAINTLGATIAEPWEITQSTRQKNQPEGLLVTRIISGGQANQSGLRKGDLITAINGQKVLYRNQLLSTLRHTSPDQEVELKIISLNEPNTIILRKPPSN